MTSFLSWRFALITFLKDLERRESGTSELKQLIIRLIREQCKLVITIREDPCQTLISKTGLMVIQRTSDLEPLGRMIDTIHESIHIHTDTIMSISQIKSTRMFSEEPWELLRLPNLTNTTSA